MQHGLFTLLLCLLGLAIALPAGVSEQLVLTAEYERLRRYEGTYEHEGGGTLQIVSSRDSVLVAILGGPDTR